MVSLGLAISIDYYLPAIQRSVFPRKCKHLHSYLLAPLNHELHLCLKKNITVLLKESVQ